MVSSEVKRTLVKSPPELWAELSDPAALARHLGDLGDVGNMRITRVHAEERVDWEADRISGTVLMKASGWGTKVTLRVSRELGEIPSPADSDEPPVESMPVDHVVDEDAGESVEARMETDPHSLDQPDTVDTDSSSPLDSNLETSADPSAEDAPEQPAIAETETPSLEEVLTDQQVQPRRGFFSRLFRPRRMAQAQAPTAAETSDEPLIGAGEDQARGDTSTGLLPSPASPEPMAEEPPVQEAPTALDSGTEAEPDESAPVAELAQAPVVQDPDVSADLKAAEDVAAEEVVAVLTATLDRLGAAHHRPFSRS